MPDEDIQRKTLRWLADGETGESSETMAYWLAFNIKRGWGVCHPHDPADFDRCLKLLAAVPELRPDLPRMRELGPAWSALVSRWIEIETCFLSEAGLGWANAARAPKTFVLMRSILDAVASKTRETA